MLPAGGLTRDDVLESAAEGGEVLFSPPFAPDR